MWGKNILLIILETESLIFVACMSLLFVRKEGQSRLYLSLIFDSVNWEFYWCMFSARMTLKKLRRGRQNKEEKKRKSDQLAVLLLMTWLEIKFPAVKLSAWHIEIWNEITCYLKLYSHQEGYFRIILHLQGNHEEHLFLYNVYSDERVCDLL